MSVELIKGGEVGSQQISLGGRGVSVIALPPVPLLCRFYVKAWFKGQPVPGADNYLATVSLYYNDQLIKSQGVDQDSKVFDVSIETQLVLFSTPIFLYLNSGSNQATNTDYGLELKF